MIVSRSRPAAAFWNPAGVSPVTKSTVKPARSRLARSSQPRSKISEPLTTTMRPAAGCIRWAGAIVLAIE